MAFVPVIRGTFALTPNVKAGGAETVVIGPITDPAGAPIDFSAWSDVELNCYLQLNDCIAGTDNANTGYSPGPNVSQGADGKIAFATAAMRDNLVGLGKRTLQGYLTGRQTSGDFFELLAVGTVTLVSN